MGPQGEKKEHYTAQDWCYRVENIGSSLGWSPEIQASNAALALVPLSPADFWYRVTKKQKDLSTWPEFRKALLLQFAPEVTAAERVSTIRSMRQNPREKVTDYLNRLKLQFESLQDGVKNSFADLDKTEDAAHKSYRHTVVERTMRYVLQCLFLAGLQDQFVTEIAKSDAKDLDEFVKVAQRLESASAHKKVSAIETQVYKESESISKNEIQEMIAAAVRSKAKPEKGSTKRNRKSSTSSGEKVWCYFCLQPGHMSKDCQEREKERKAGHWRPTIKCQKMSKEAFQKLSYEEKTKGKTMLAGAQNVTTVSARPAHEGQHTYTWASQEPIWAEYAQGN